jgi:hypothetical protein
VLAGGVGLVGLALVVLVGIVQDLARASAVRFAFGASEALRTALRTFAGGKARITWSWTWRALAASVPIAFGILLAGRLGGRRGAVLYVLLGIHQLIVGVRAALRVSWLSSAMRSVDAKGKA